MGLLWEGNIANTGETGESRTIYGYIYADASRTNNTVTVSNFYVGHRADLNPTYWDWEWQTSGYINGTYVLNAQTKGRTGGANVYNATYNSSTASLAVGVGTGGGSIGVSANWRSDHYGNVSGQRGTSIAYPAAGYPTGTTGAPYTITTNSIKIKNDVTSWGSYCTAGSVRSYRADNSSFNNQTYISTTDNAEVTHTGLNSNDEYWFRGWCSNGAGLTAYMGSTRTAVTLPKAPVISGVTDLKANQATIATTIDNGGGKYTITKQYRIKETDGGTYSDWVTYTGSNIELSGLRSYTDYTVEVQSVTTAGTTVGSTIEFQTKRVSGNFLPLMMG